jgi:hypothetical protein
MKRALWYWALMPMVVLLLLEGSLRILGYKPYRTEKFSQQSNPEFWIIPDSSLGFALNPGSFHVTVNDELEFEVAHTQEGLRYIPVRSVDSTSFPLEDFAFFGGSFTYGWGLNDEETFPAQFAEESINYCVQNYAVPGHGMVQGFLQLKQLISENKAPDYAVFCYLPFHDDRNAATMKFQFGLLQGYSNSNPETSEKFGIARFPFIRIENGKLKVDFLSWDEKMKHWPLRQKSSLINLLQGISITQADQKLKKEEATLALFEEIESLCHYNDVNFMIYILSNDRLAKQAKNRFEEKGLPVLMSNIDLTDKQWTFYPDDDHPNQNAHKELGNLLSDYFKGAAIEQPLFKNF